MPPHLHVATPPPKPLMVFDGDCNFCTLWIRRWRQMTGDAVDYLPSQDPQIAERFPEIPGQQFQKSVQLIEPDGSVFSGAEAVFRALAKKPKWQWPLRLYQSSPVFSKFTERAYEYVAGHRTGFSLLTRFLWGRHVEQPNYFLTRWIFLRALGVIYLIAFISLWVQIAGLIGHDGILPANRLISTAKQQFDAQGIGAKRYYWLPTLFWVNSSNRFLDFQCAAGTTLAVLLILGIAPAPCLALLWLIYLSLMTVGGDFLAFQWDNLLLEVGFLSIFFAPLRFWPRPSHERPASKIVLWLLRLLLFKLMFSSGCAKLASGDPHWRDLTALAFHYQTQPLPTPVAWYASQSPLWFLKLSCAVMFLIELAAPFLIFAPRRLRFIGAGAIAFLQVLISLTGNYTFFNWLTLALCLLLLDDFVFQKIFPRKLAALFTPGNPLPVRRHFRWFHAIAVPLTIVYISISLFQIAAIFGVRTNAFYPVAVVGEWLAPFRTINNYGLFAVMTTERHEIVVEGSNDGTHWLAYEFKFKPGDVNKRPAFVAPHQPRLDWQMWFAALGSYRQNPWFVNFCLRLLQGSPPVLNLMAKNPFPDHPPLYIRAELYDYEFANFAERRATDLRHTGAATSAQAGAWWKRELIGEYLPPVSLSTFGKK